MKTSFKIKKLFVCVLSCLLLSCEDFLEIQPPTDKIVRETVFSSDETATSAMKGIYNQLMAGGSFSNGSGNSVTVLSSLSSNVVNYLHQTNTQVIQFEQHEIFPDNSRIQSLWSTAYNTIYMTNSLLEGLDGSDNISQEILRRLEGEAKFVRAFTYLYLVNLFGEVPLILTTNYQYNSLAERDFEEDVYQQIVFDLEDAIELLDDGYIDGERTRANKSAAISLMARVQLYLNNWKEAENFSSLVINNNTSYGILEDLDEVFLANSNEAIWQLSPIGAGNTTTHTNEGSFFIIDSTLSSSSANIKLSDEFMTGFKDNDQRLDHWINYDVDLASFFPYKYKVKNSNEPPIEYSMVLRLAEQYLIRAEARTMLGDFTGAISDVDIIRERAGVQPLSEINPSNNSETLLTLILKERQNEFFTEWGHRWLDLKRTNRISEVLSVVNPSWQDTDQLYPIPESEQLRNPNLTQNLGY